MPPNVERKTRFELAISTLARWHSTTESLPHSHINNALELYNNICILSIPCLKKATENATVNSHTNLRFICHREIYFGNSPDSMRHFDLFISGLNDWQKHVIINNNGKRSREWNFRLNRLFTGALTMTL